MRKLFALFPLLLGIALVAAADEVAFRSLQSGAYRDETPVHDRGIYGQGQIIAVLDTGVDYWSCFFVEPDNAPPPFNTGTPTGGLSWQNVDLARRKIIAYDYLFSCDQYPNAAGCDQTGTLASLDNQGHGTHTASTATGDRGVPLEHDYADGVAPGAKLIVQDGGFVNGDLCTQFPGVGCPAKLTPIFEQAYRQGARIHSNSWGDRQGRALPPTPTANYPQSAYDVDAFVWSHPDLLVVFNTGNLNEERATPTSSLSAPGSAKNTLQIGGTRIRTNDDDTLAYFTLFGPARDGRIKPDLVAPARVLSGSRDLDNNPNTCDDSRQPGTSFASPTITGAAALVRQYFTDGFYPTGAAVAANQLTPSAALLKATLIASARAVPWRGDILTETKVPALPVPSHEQGWGFPVLDDALYFAGDTRKLQVVDVPLATGLAEGESSSIRVNVKPGTPLKAVLVWTDPPGHIASPSDPTPQLVNDLDLRVTTSAGTSFGNGSAPDRINNVEVVSLDAASGTATITVTAHELRFGARQSYALVLLGVRMRALMLSREYLREHADDYRRALQSRGATVDLDRFTTLDADRRRTIAQGEQLKAQKNAASQEIANLKKNKQDATAQIDAMKRVGDEIKALDESLAAIEEELKKLELYFPNVPHESVPVGNDESANRVERHWGRKPSFDFTPKDHADLGEQLGIIDFERAVKVTGSRFSILYGAGAKLSRALMNFMLDVHERQGYTEVLPPFIVNADSMRGTGQLPKFAEDLFKLEHEKELYLVPTAEVPVTNIYRDEILDGAQLPVRFTAYTPCFRSEAGSYGRDTRGLIRQHQFEKVELVKFTAPEQSWDELEQLVADAEEILQLLELHYRVVTLSTGDMSFSSAKTYDIEVWLPGQETYREISSCSNFTDFQARRANIRYRSGEKKTGFVHTLNGSGLPLGRTLVAVLENYQQADGSVIVPEALRPYMRGVERISK